MTSAASLATQSSAQTPGQQSGQVAYASTLPSASARYQITPCIVLGAGPVISAEFERLRESVEFWLGDSFPKAAVQWSCIDSIIGATSKDLEEWAEQLIQPLLSIELWRYLLKGKYIDGLPSAGQPAPIRVYILYDPGDKPFDSYLLETLSHYLALAAMYRRTPTSSQRARLKQTLILPWLGHKHSPINAAELRGIDKLFESICVIEQVGQSGLAFTDPRMRYEVMRLFLHALVASETADMASQWQAGQAGQTSSGPQADYLGVGSSGITSALAHMREYRTARILQFVIAPYAGTLTDEEQTQYREAGEQTASQVNRGWWEPTIRVLVQNQWVITGNDTSRPYNQDLLYPGGKLAQALRTCSDNLAELLGMHLIEVARAIKEEFSHEKQERLEQLLSQAAELTLGDSEPADRHRYNPQEQGCLARVLHWFEGLMQAAPELETIPTSHRFRAVYAADEAGWRQHAISEATKASIRHRAFVRLQQATGTPGQLLLRAFPAWPLFSLLSQSFINYPVWLTWLGTFILLLLVAIPSFLLWKRRLDAMDRALHHERLAQVRQLVFGIATHYAIIENAATLSALNEVRHEVKELLAALERQQGQIAQIIEDIHLLIQQKTRQPHLIEYFLYDLERCDEWVRTIIDTDILGGSQLTQSANSATAGQASVSVGRFVGTIIRNTIMGRLLGRIASQGIANISSDLGKHELDVRQLTAIELCDREPDTVNTDNRWSWLYTSAHPMARADQYSKELAIVALGDISDLTGGYGQSSDEWRKNDLREARSRQPHRLTCVRLITLPTDYLTRI